jgi:iron complex outermembrane receptor protein
MLSAITCGLSISLYHSSILFFSGCGIRFFCCMKTLSALLFVLLFNLPAYSQISGKLASADSVPVGFATVSVIKSSDSSAVRSVLSDENGSFVLNGIPNGNYILKVSSLGYVTWFSQPFLLNIAQLTHNAGVIVLTAASKQLGEVLIRARKPLVQQLAGGLQVNVQSSLMAKGSSVLQVLQRSPGVVIDPQHSGISLNGKSGVMVMMDGKLLRLSTAQVSTLLNGMSADDVDKIELLTHHPPGTMPMATRALSI